MSDREAVVELLRLSKEAEDRVARFTRQRDFAKARGEHKRASWYDGWIASECDLQDAIDVAVDRLRRHPHGLPRPSPQTLPCAGGSSG
ncbi:hypothetical protein [Microvirga sp. G4-2]|uniref:hypothetical protein n=1 Tax=Microvirga sp. G4-2 TaxID=3434467 RepID=UPI004043F5FA